MRKSIWILAIAVGVLAFAFPAMAAPTGKITVAFDTDTPTMDPHMHAERAGVIVNWHIFDSLFFRQNDMSVVPGLVESYETLDPTTLQLKLKQGIKFHNGEDFNAECVKFSIDRVLDPQSKSPRITAINWIESVEIVDDNTVKLHLKNPYPLWQQELQNFAMVPVNYVKEKGNEYFGEHPVGTGPYKFVKWTRGQEIVLTANDDYFKGAARIKDVVFKIIPDASTQLAALMSGSVDVLRNISPEDIPMFQARKNISVYTVPILRFNWFYLSDALTAGSPLADKRVRQALNYAINIPEIIENIVGGLGTQCLCLNPMHFGYDPTVKPYPYDPEKAKALLKEAGFGDGFSITLHYTTVNMIKAEEVCQAIQDQLSKVNVEMKLQKWSGVGYMDLIRSGRAKPVFSLNWGSFGVFDGDAILYPFFRSGQQYAFFHTPELDELIDAQHQEMDPEKRKEIMSKIQHIIKDEAPWIFMYAFHSVKAANSKLDFKPRSDETFYAYEIGFK